MFTPRLVVCAALALAASGGVASAQYPVYGYPYAPAPIIYRSAPVYPVYGNSLYLNVGRVGIGLGGYSPGYYGYGGYPYGGFGTSLFFGNYGGYRNYGYGGYRGGYGGYGHHHHHR